MPRGSIPQSGMEWPQTIRPGATLTLDEAFAVLEGERLGTWRCRLRSDCSVVVDTRWASPHESPPQNISAFAQRSSSLVEGHLSLNTIIIAYEYQLSVGGQVVTEEEWQQLVNAKTPLVQFRGQWMELDRDKMQQLLAVLADTSARRARDHAAGYAEDWDSEAEDDLEWDHDQSLQDMLSKAP